MQTKGNNAGQALENAVPGQCWAGSGNHPCYSMLLKAALQAPGNFGQMTAWTKI